MTLSPSSADWARIVIVGHILISSGQKFSYRKLAAAAGVSTNKAERAWKRRDELEEQGFIGRREVVADRNMLVLEHPIKKENLL